MINIAINNVENLCLVINAYIILKGSFDLPQNFMRVC